MDIAAAIEQGSGNPLFLFGMALLLGALHGLEPGHSKTMMAAFIIAVRGSVTQAILLGLSAAVSHSIVVWALAAAALYYGNEMIGEEAEPWFLMISGLIVLVIALWSFRQIRQGNGFAAQLQAHHEENHHDHGAHSHGSHGAHSHGASAEELLDDDLKNDAHARAHAAEISRSFASGRASNWQTILFGLTGGLLPCSAAITVLILCLHLDRVYLGAGLVLAFSGGLAITLVAIGVAASIGLRMARKRSDKVDLLFKRAPYISAVLIAVIGAVMFYSGYAHLPT